MILRRDVEFGFDPASVPRDWYGGDPFVTSHFDALSLLFPEGERFFVESVKQLRHHAEDPALRAAIAGFIGQEAMHGREHRAFNAMMAAHGDRVAPAVDAWLRGFLATVRGLLSPRSQLAVTAALEHFTAMLAERMLRDERLCAPMHPAVRDLWRWHALEESEHKAVAFDLYRAAGGGYPRRVVIMVLATIVFVAVVAAVQARLLAGRAIRPRPWRWARGLARFWIRPGFYARSIPAYLSWFRPGFHPDDRDTAALLEAWRRELFGAGGPLEAAA